MIRLPELLGESPGITAVREQIGRLLEGRLGGRRLPPVLIQGETGTGKGLLARAIHRAGPRRNGPFVDLNCAAIPETLLEAELFGFERGAFTDARQAKAGLFQTANGGTLFLDEVGLLPDTLQSKLLKVIEEQTVRRLGATRSEAVDVWIVSASSEDLASATRQRRYRTELYHRLAVLTVWLPPLRERAEDVVLLAEHFLKRACADFNLGTKSLAPGARTALLAYSWPGNVRELANVIERVALLSEDSVVTADMLGVSGSPETAARVHRAPDTAVPLKAQLGEVEQKHLRLILEETGWNLSRAAARLGIARNTLRYRLQKHGLRPEPTTSAHLSRPVPTPAVSQPQPTTGYGLRWEPRRLTLLRVSLVTASASGLPLRGGRALEAAAEKVEAFGGRVEELGPSGLVAVFGIEPTEDAPQRAAHAAMAIRKAAQRATLGAGDAPAITQAIHVGQFLVGHGRGAAEIDLDTKRDTWTVLETLLAQADPDSIVVSDTAAPFLERRFDLSAQDDTGRDVRVAYRLINRERPSFLIGRRIAAFVGRAQNLELLRSHLASVMRGHGHAIGIVGEAGIGKSRLLAEFRQSLVGQPVTYREGTCLSYGGAIPYLPVLDVLRQNCRIAEGDSAEQIGEKVRRSLATVGMNADEWAPYLLQLLGVTEGTERLSTLTAEAIKFRTLETLRAMMTNASRQWPIIFAIEDLHWIDKTSEELLASLVNGLPGVPIMFLSTYRPGYRPPWIDRSYATQMALQPLSPDDSRRIMRSILQTEVPEPLTQLVLDKAEGNPFFLEELCRAVEEQGDLRTLPAVPDTIQEVLLARIHRLPDEPRQLLQMASVLGREVSSRLLAAMWEGPGPLDAHLAGLISLEFLYQRTGRDEPVYVFNHPLTQDVAYASLGPSRRQALHAAAGRALEAFYSNRLEEAYDRLAHHYSKTEAADKAVEYLSRFAEKAARSYAHEEAVRALMDAITHVRGLPAAVQDRRRLELVLRLPYSLLPLGRVQEILALLLQQPERVERLGDPALAGHFYFLLGRTWSFLGEHEKAAQNAERAIAEASRCDDLATTGKALSLLALEAVLSGRSLQGIEHARRAVALLEKTDERWWLADAHWLLGLNFTQIGEFGPALEAEARAASLGEAIGDQRLQASAGWVTGIVQAALGEPDLGTQTCRKALEQAPDPLNTTISMGWLGFTHLEKGDATSAIPLLEQSIRRLHEFGFREFEGWFTVFLAEAHRIAGRLEDAEQVASQALQISGAAKFTVGVGWASLALGRIARAQGDLQTSEARLHEALRIFGAVHSRYESARTRLDLAAVVHARGDADATRQHLAAAHALFTTLRVPRYVERVERWAKELGLSLR